MKFTCPQLWKLAVLSALTVIHQLAGAASFEWTGAGNNLFWSTPANWSPAGPPGPNDEARFFDTGSTNHNLSINNVVSADITIERLWVGPTNGSPALGITAAHNMFINPGVTLTVKGTNDNK